MLVIRHTPTQCVLRFDRGDEVLGLLRDFCMQHNIGGAMVQGIGAVQRVTLSFYNLAARTYQERSITMDAEIVSLQGNVTLRDNQPHIHIHGCFSYANMETNAGHVHDMVVSVTCELFLQLLEAPIHRKYDDTTGLALLCNPAEDAPTAAA